jgi:phage-related protein (TIGR01555 family)
MAERRASAKALQKQAGIDERRLQRESKQTTGLLIPPSPSGVRTIDSFNNFLAKLGVGADNLFSAGTYGFNPITRQRTLLEWIHRGSWIGGLAVDTVADDMTRAGVTITGTLKPEERELIEECAIALDIWGATNDGIKWSRLYGGAIGVHLVEGQDLSTPLKAETIKKGQYKGILVLDRWMADPSVNDLVTEMGPYLGLPKFYTANAQGPGLRGKKIHYSRVIRLEGDRLPYWQRVTENLWGSSVLERIYDRLLAFDSATQGAAQLVYKSYLRSIKIKDLRKIVGLGGPALDGLLAQVEMMRAMQTNEGITLLDGDDEFGVNTTAPFTGLAEALVHFGQQISGALQIPLVRLFGQSPAGLNSTGESDLRTYYDGILQRQNKALLHPMTITYRLVAANLGIKPGDGFGIKFNSLWQLTETEKAEIASKDTDTFAKGVSEGLVTPVVAMREMRKSSALTGRWGSIDDDMIKQAEEMDQVPTATQVEAAEVKEGEEPGAEETAGTSPKPTQDAKWEESSHERKSNGEFGVGNVPASGKKGSRSAGKTQKPSSASHGAGSTVALFKLKKVSKPVFTGKPVTTKRVLTKLETGSIGESVVMSYLKSIGLKSPRPLNSEQNNYPIDVVAILPGPPPKDQLVECKTGIVSNGPSAQQWRATIGQPGKAATEWLKTASSEDKKEFNQKKAQDILERKAAALKRHQKETGRKVVGKTITTILNPDTNTADIYEFTGFHSRIAWNSPEARAAYRGTYAYSA